MFVVILTILFITNPLLTIVVLYSVHARRENSLKGLISVESPIGKAIYGKKVGDRVKVTVNEKYEYYVVIRSITKTFDDSDDRIRPF